MFQQICGSAVIVCLVAIASMILGESKYKKSTEARREAIRKWRKEGLSRNEIAVALNKSGYRNKKGEKFTGKEVSAELVEMATEK